MVEIRGYIDERGNKRFANWFTELDANAAAKVNHRAHSHGARKLLEREGRRLRRF